MTITLLTLLLAAVGFVWGRLRADVVALIALMILAVSGTITTTEALSGFANPIVIMMIGLFVVGGAIFNTGLAKMAGARLLKLAGNSETRLFLLVMGGTALIGGFVSNTGTVALMLPIVVSMAASSSINVRRILMPLAFASSMGGMLTLIGTPPNLVISEVWEEAGNEPMSFFTFLPAGLICLAAGTIILMPLSKLFLSDRKSDKHSSEDGKSLDDLVEEYDLNEGLRALTVRNNSSAAGKTLAELNLRTRYGIEVLEVRTGNPSRPILKNVKQFAVDPTAPLSAGETLYVRGTADHIAQFAKKYNLKEDSKHNGLQFYDIGMAEIVPMPNSPILKHSVADLAFRSRYGVNVIGIRRKNEVLSQSIGDIKIQAGDVLLVQGSWNAISDLSSKRNQWVVLGQPLEEASKVTFDYKAPVAAVIMLGMIVSLVFDFVPPVISVIVAALLMVLVGCFRSVADAYKTINWESVVLIAAMMPMSFALEKTGVSELVAGSLADVLGGHGPLLLLAGIYVTTSIMTLFISNTACAVLMAPIALESALLLGVSPLPFLFAVTFGASLCFASPFSTPPNALVMPAGQYSFGDYLKVGLPLQLILGVVMIFVLPLVFPF